MPLILVLLASLLFTSLLLAIGLLVRSKTPLLQKLYVPGSVVAGFLGLCLLGPLVAAVPATAEVDDARQTASIDANAAVLAFHDHLKAWPKWLIAVVFAALLLESPSRSFRQSAKQAWQEGCVVWVVVLGQTAVGLWLTWLVLKPVFGVSNSFAMLIETGFAGGHGTAAAMGLVFESPAVGLQNGRDLGVMMATVGLITSVTTGILYLNIAVRKGWTRDGRQDAGTLVVPQTDEQRVASRSRREFYPLSVLLTQVLLLALAFGIGMLLQRASTEAAIALSPAVEPESSPATVGRARLSAADIVGSFPLFIYTLFGGLIVRRLAVTAKCSHLIQAGALQSIVGVTMDYLVVAAIATLNVFAIASSAAPLLVLIVAGLAWTAFCLFVVSRWLLPKDYWFELGLLNYGMSTGTTATGFVLLRVADPGMETRAAEDYALAAPISSPFIGGGVVTLILPPLVLERSENLMLPCLASVGLMAVFAWIAWMLKRSG